MVFQKYNFFFVHVTRVFYGFIGVLHGYNRGVKGGLKCYRGVTGVY